MWPSLGMQRMTLIKVMRGVGGSCPACLGVVRASKIHDALRESALVCTQAAWVSAAIRFLTMIPWPIRARLK